MKPAHDPSFLDTLIDVLSFYQNGNWSKFDHSFNLALNYYGVKIPKAESSKLRRFAVSYLRSMGFITVCYDPTFYWSFTNNAIVQIKNEEFAAVGTSQFRVKFHDNFKDDSLFVPYRNPLHFHSIENLLFYPKVPIVYLRLSKIKAFCDVESIHLVSKYGQRMFKALPTIEKGIKHSLMPVTATDYLNPESSFFFNFKELIWQAYEGFEPTFPGLFRKDNKYRPTEYFVAQKKFKHYLKTYQIMNPDWIYLIGAKLLDQAFKLRYDQNKSILSFELGEARFPDIVEQTLRSPTLKVPSYEDGWRQYSEISMQYFILFKSKLHTFCLEEE